MESKSGGQMGQQEVLVWAFDPGHHCGWVVYSTQKGVLGTGEPVIKGPWSCAAMLSEMAELGSPVLGDNPGFWPDVVVYEDFRLSPGNRGGWSPRVGLSPVYCMAWIQGIAVGEGVLDGVLWVAQMPGERSVISSAMLSAVPGLWVRGGLGHSHDAGRHLLVWLRKMGLEPK